MLLYALYSVGLNSMVKIKNDFPSTIPEFGNTLNVLDGSGKKRKYVGVSD